MGSVQNCVFLVLSFEPCLRIWLVLSVSLDFSYPIDFKYDSHYSVKSAKFSRDTNNFKVELFKIKLLQIISAIVSIVRCTRGQL